MTAAAMPKAEVLVSQQDIARRVAEIGGEVARAFAGREICVVGLMKSCLVFMGDLSGGREGWSVPASECSVNTKGARPAVGRAPPRVAFFHGSLTRALHPNP